MSRLVLVPIRAVVAISVRDRLRDVFFAIGTEELRHICGQRRRGMDERTSDGRDPMTGKGNVKRATYLLAVAIGARSFVQFAVSAVTTHAVDLLQFTCLRARMVG